MPDDQAPSEVLSQSEVENILASMGEVKPDVGPKESILGRRSQKSDKAPVVQAFDLHNPVYLSPSRLRRLRLHHETFAQKIAASVSFWLRREFSLQLSKIEIEPFQKIRDLLPTPTYLSVFKLKPLPGLCALEITPRLGFAVVDRLTGGQGFPPQQEREFSNIEKSILDQFCGLVLREYCESWSRHHILEWEIIEHENVPRFLNIVDRDGIVLFFEIESRFGECTAPMRCLLPYRSIESMAQALMTEATPQEGMQVLTKKSHVEPLNSCFQVTIPVSAHWMGFAVTLGQLQNLSVGDVLFLDNKKCEQAVIDLGPVPKFKGRVDRHENRVSVTIQSKIQ